MASNHPRNYVGLEKTIITAINNGEEELSSKAVIFRKKGIVLLKNVRKCWERQKLSRKN